MFDFFITNHFISTNQTGFKPGDSCFNQLVSVTHGICASFYEGYEVEGAFLSCQRYLIRFDMKVSSLS